MTTKLPFDDDEFDHVHIQSIAKGVPENKVDYILDYLTLLTLSAIVGGLVRSESFFPSGLEFDIFGRKSAGFYDLEVLLKS